MIRALAMIALIGCETPPPPPAPPALPEESVHAEDGPLSLSIRRIEQDAWSGRLIVATFAPRARTIRVVPSEGPRPLDAIVGPIGSPQPFAAIDGGFYDLEGAPMGLVRTGGEDVARLREGGGSGVFFVDDAPHIVHRDAYRPTRAIREAVQSIDRLVADGASLVSPNASDRRAARSAIAISADGALHLVVAFDQRAIALEEDARIVLDEDSGTTGPTLGEMAALLISIGARDALGLDGGLSTSLTVKSAEHALRVEAFRATINAILVHAS
jgi:hypothetical protein